VCKIDRREKRDCTLRCASLGTQPIAPIDFSASIQEFPLIRPKSSEVLLVYLDAYSVHLPLGEDHVVVSIALRLMVAVVHWCVEIVCTVYPLDWDGVRRH
jgi:hypothetical protein